MILKLLHFKTSIAGAAPGCLLREPCYCCASPEKVAGGRGGGGGVLRHIVLDFKFFFFTNFHNGVGVSSWT